MEKEKAIGVALIIIGLLVVLHHYIFWQKIADIDDVLHHEFFEAIFITAGITQLISTHYSRNRSART